MNLYKKLSCVCGHESGSHIPGCRACHCQSYEANGHNPELENVTCPKCKLARFEKPVPNLYVCPQCGYALSEAMVWRLVG